jgi:hypothetical protein
MPFRQIVLLITLLAVVVSCQKSNEPPEQVSESWFGQYYAKKIGFSVDKLDSVELAIYGDSYSLFHYAGPGGSNPVDFCNSNGTLIGYGTNRVTLVPTDTIGTNCDGLRMPQGELSARYPTDSLILSDTVTVRYYIGTPPALQLVEEDWELTLSLTQ